MEKSKLSVICGLRIADATLEENNVTLTFENGIILAIYNKHKLDGFVLKDAQRLIGNIVSRVDDELDTTTIKFDNNLAILVDMCDDAYTGPEAMQLRIPGKPIVIWN